MKSTNTEYHQSVTRILKSSKSSSAIKTTSVEGMKAVPAITWEQFMLINAEIDRLTTLCSTLSERNKVLQARLGQSADSISQSESIHIELRENDARVSMLEQQNAELREENQKMALKISEKMHIIEEWKRKHSKLEKSSSDVELQYSQNASLNVEMGRLKDELAHYKSSEANIAKFRTQVEVLMTEKQELDILLREKENLIVELRGQLETSNSMTRRVEVHEHSSSSAILVEKDRAISDLRSKLVRLEEQVMEMSEWKSKALTFTAENQRLLRAVEERSREIESIRTRVSQPVEVMHTTSNVNVSVSVQEKNRLEMLVAEKSQECESLRVRLAEREKLVSSPVKSEYKEKIVVVTKEVENLNTVISTKEKEIEALNAKLKAIAQEKSKIVIERDTVIQEKTRLEMRLAEKDHEYDTLKLKLREADKASPELLELRQKLALISSENERLSTYIAEKKKEVASLNAKSVEYHDLELKWKLSVQENNRILIEKETAIQERQGLEMIVAEITEEYEALQLKFRETEKVYSELSELKGKLSIMTSETERLNILIYEKEEEIGVLTSKVESLNVKIVENEKINSELRVSVEEAQRTYVEKEREYKTSVETNKTQVRNVETAFTGSYTMPTSSTVIRQETYTVSSDLMKLERELSRRAEQIRQFEERIALLTIENKQLVQARDIAGATSACDIREVETLRARASEANILSLQLKVYENEKEEVMKLMDKDKRTFERALYERELSIKDLQAKNMAQEQRVAHFEEISAKLSHVTAEKERLVIAFQDKAREIDVLRSEVHQLNVKSQKRVVIEESHTTDILLNEKSREISSLKLRIAQLEKGTHVSEELKEQLKTTSMKYEAIISNLNERLSEVEALRLRCSQLAEIETKLTILTRERDEAVNLYRINRQEIDKYQEKIVRLEAQVVELNTFKSHQVQISSPTKFVSVDVNRDVEKYQEKIVRLEAQVAELSAIRSYQSSPTKVTHIETRDVQRETELNNVITDLKAKLNAVMQEKERLVVIVSQKESEVVKVRSAQSSKQSETLLKVQTENEELMKEKLRLTAMCEEYVKQIEVLMLRVKEIDMFSIEKQRLLEIISTKTREIQMLEQKLFTFENEVESLKQIAIEKERLIEEIELKLFAKETVREVRISHESSLLKKAEPPKRLKNSMTEKTLKTKLSYLTGFEDEFQSIIDERDQLESKVAEKQKSIQALQVQVASVEKELVSSGELKSKVTLLDSESKRLNNVAMERLTKLNMTEQQLTEANKEKSLLSLEVSEKQVEVSLLKTKLVEVERQARLVTELQGKLSMMVLENERLTKDLAEKNQFIADLKYKYATLENVYLHVRGNMKKPDAINKKYQDTIRAIEQVEHKLGLYGRSKAMKKTLSVQSILQPDNSQAYSLHVDPITDSGIFSATSKTSTTMQKVIIQKAI